MTATTGTTATTAPSAKTMPARRIAAAPTSLAALAALTLALAGAPSPARAQAAAPPNAPARLTRSADRLTLTYEGRPLLDARLTVRGRLDVRTLVDTAPGGAITQVVKLTAFGDSARIEVAATVAGSAESWALEPEPRADAVTVVRHASGPSFSRLNRGVYDRARDWLLSVDHPARVRVTPGAGADSTRFAVEARGFEVALRFRPRWFARHRGLARFEPWLAPLKARSVAGWTSWFAFLDTVREAHVAEAARVVGRELAPWGFTVIQLDDGYQRLPLGPFANWLNTNAKFPGGVSGIRRLMGEAGLEPGIWTNVAFEDTAYARAHPQLFVRDASGQPAYGTWVGFALDGSERAALDTLVRPVYRALRREGFTYFKLDALRHLRYEGYNSAADHFARKGADRAQAFRSVVAAVRREIGDEAYLLACWGIRPELTGLVDAVRTGTDGFGYGGFAQYNSWNNVTWRNDPDHVEAMKPDGLRAATLASLTGSLLMLTDAPAAYHGERLEAVRRTAPVLFTRPGQGYDVDPSRSSRIALADGETSGSGPRPFDADRAPRHDLTLLEVSRPWGHWAVLARTGGDSVVRFADLGLPDDRPVLAYEFWSRTDLGAHMGRLVAPPVDAERQVQLLCLREQETRPQLITTSRHVSCGGADVRSLGWSERTLAGTLDLVGGEATDIVLTEPDGWHAASVEAEGATLEANVLWGNVRTIRLKRATAGVARWRVRYE